jgi:hypothetical protein
MGYMVGLVGVDCAHLATRSSNQALYGNVGLVSIILIKLFPLISTPMRIYTSPYPAPTLPTTSIFSYLFPEKPSDSPLPAHDPDSAAFIDGLTGRTLSRRDVEDGALRLASGLKSRGLGKGSTALIIGPNSLEWIVGAFGLLAAGVCCSPANTAL